MTLKQLEAFYWAATCLNFTVAAERVYLSTSSLSKRVSELEESLGVKLFDRSGRGAELTRDGEQMLPRAKALLHAADQLRDSVGQPGSLQGRCRIGLGEMSALTWLPSLLKKMSELHPLLEVEPSVGTDEVLERRVGDGELDCAVLAGPSSRGKLAAEGVGHARLVWVGAAAFIDRAGTDLPQQLMKEHLFISLPEGSGPTRVLDQWLARNAVAVNRRLNCNNWGAVVGMVSDGLGFGFMPQLWAEAMQKRGSLQILTRGAPLAPLHYMMQWRRDDSRPVIAEMRNLTKSLVKFSAPRCFC